MHRDQNATNQATKPAGLPPSTHELAVMVWVCVFPTLTVMNLVLADWLITLAPVLRTLVLSTLAVPLIVYGLMPALNRLRIRLTTRDPSGPLLTGRRRTAAGHGR